MDASRLRARLDEDESDIGVRDHDSGQCDYLRGVHLEPDRALREVAAKRAILDEYERDQQADDQYRAGLAFALDRLAEVYKSRTG